MELEEWSAACKSLDEANAVRVRSATMIAEAIKACDSDCANTNSLTHYCEICFARMAYEALAKKAHARITELLRDLSEAHGLVEF